MGPISSLRSLDILLIRLSYTGYNVALKDLSNRSSLVYPPNVFTAIIKDSLTDVKEGSDLSSSNGEYNPTIGYFLPAVIGAFPIAERVLAIYCQSPNW